MQKLILAPVLFILIPSSGEYKDVNANKYRISGGTFTSISKYPFMASIQIYGLRSTHHVCAGSIITKRLILTAAHCLIENMYRVKKDPSSLSVVVGKTQLSTKNSDNRYEVEAVYPHAYFRDSSYHDIGILKLAKPIEFSKNVKRVKLPTANKSCPVGSHCVVPGWGYTQQNTFRITSDQILQEVMLPVVNIDECGRQYRSTYYKEIQLCTSFPQSGKGACKGDSGGPLICDGEQHGVVSWGEGCGENKPVIYTKVSYYIDWINHMQMTQSATSLETNKNIIVICLAICFVLINLIK